MTLYRDIPNLHQTANQHKECREHEFAGVSEPKPTHGGQVCALQVLWKLWQHQCTPEAMTRVLATEESPEMQATSTVPTNHEALTAPTGRADCNSKRTNDSAYIPPASEKPPQRPL